ncbi:hypothetical protein OAM01_02065 [bacterium]|nr:hypothetical protein [bacterium]
MNLAHLWLSFKQTDKVYPLTVTDGYKFYERAIRKCFGKCLYAQIIKTRRNDRVTKVERRMIIGAKPDFEKALLNSEDSETLNTSFIGCLNLTIRQSTSFTIHVQFGYRQLTE